MVSGRRTGATSTAMRAIELPCPWVTAHKQLWSRLILPRGRATHETPLVFCVVWIARPDVGVRCILAGGCKHSSAELSVGGLSFTRSPDVAMESEDLSITPERVTVRYRFLNVSQKPVTLTVAFPLPDIDLSDGENIAIPAEDLVNFVGFETEIDDSPIAFTMSQRAFLGDKDVSAVLTGMGVPLLPLGALHAKLDGLSAANRNKLIDDGLLIQSGMNEQDKPIYGPGWIVKTSAVRQQTFPTGRAVTVEHRYKTSLGVSFDTVLRKSLRRTRQWPQKSRAIARITASPINSSPTSTRLPAQATATPRRCRNAGSATSSRPAPIGPARSRISS